jgi:heptosyltransferase II
MLNDKIKSVPWHKSHFPKRILFIRLQALGDIVIPLPLIKDIRNTLPKNTVIDLLTREEYALLPQSINLFDKVYVLKGDRNAKKQLLFLTLLLPKLLIRRYEIVADLQNNEISKIVRKLLFPISWTQFDKYSPISALKRNENTIKALNIAGTLKPQYVFDLKKNYNTIELLKKNDLRSEEFLFLINPAALYQNRNWPIENYLAFIDKWNDYIPNTKFLILGTSKIREKAKLIKTRFSEKVINLVEQTSLPEVIEIMKYVKLSLSEDSGLMHMAYLSAIPTICLLGSTRNDWTNPLLEHTRFFNSSDLECGNCMQAFCSKENNYCMIRIEPNQVFEKAVELYNLYY